MMPLTFENALISVIVAQAMVPLARFIYRFYRYSPFEFDPIGRTIMAQKIAMLSVLLLILVGRVLGDYPFRGVLTGVLFVIFTVLFWRMVMELEAVQENMTYDRFALWKAKRRAKKAMKDLRRK